MDVISFVRSYQFCKSDVRVGIVVLAVYPSLRSVLKLVHRQVKNLEFQGFDSVISLISSGDIPRSIGSFYY